MSHVDTQTLDDLPIHPVHLLSALEPSKGKLETLLILLLFFLSPLSSLSFVLSLSLLHVPMLAPQ